MTLCTPQIFGADPLNVVWNVVRGDTAILKVEFYETDEATAYDTSAWSYEATAYDPISGTSYELDVVASDGYATITAADDVTSNWGTGSTYRVKNLEFDLQVTTGDASIWTPVRGSISVISDITGGAL